MYFKTVVNIWLQSAVSIYIYVKADNYGVNVVLHLLICF